MKENGKNPFHWKTVAEARAC